MTKRGKYDVHAPGAQALRDQIVHGAFVTEGTMVAFPTCFPAVSLPLPADAAAMSSVDSMSLV